jgi:acylphosphatase
MACHNAATATLSSVTFPSSVEIKNLGGEAVCMQCHQGRQSTVSVDTSIKTNADPNKPDVASTKLSFANIHYFAAAATQYGTLAKGGYEYKGQSYDGKFQHPAPYDTCVGCHNSHSLELELKECATCHAGVAKVEGLADAMLNEMIDLGHGITGLALNLDETEVAVIILGEPKQIERFENLTEVRPTIIWFYDGMIEYGLPNSFNVVFFKRDAVGEYILYSPIQYGPQNLLTNYSGVHLPL